jgi:hypothetical protein
MQNLWQQPKSGGLYNRDRKDLGLLFELALAQI